MIKQTVLENDYVCFIVLSLFFLLIKFYAYWCWHKKVTPNDSGTFFET